MNVFVDTSVWSLALRRQPKDLNATEKSIADELSEVVKEGRAKTIGPIRQELLSGVKSKGQYEKLRAFLAPFTDEIIRAEDYEAAAEANNLCRSKGIAVSSIDILICAMAISRAWSVFATDPDFRRYARVLPIQLHSSRV